MTDTLKLPPELTIYTAAQLRAQWLDCVGPSHLTVDASAVAEVDAAGVQLLASLASSVAQAQGTLSLLNASQPLARACLAMGVAGLPGLNDTTGATA